MSKNVLYNQLLLSGMPNFAKIMLMKTTDLAMCRLKLDGPSTARQTMGVQRQP